MAFAEGSLGPSAERKREKKASELGPSSLGTSMTATDPPESQREDSKSGLPETSISVKKREDITKEIVEVLAT